MYLFTFNKMYITQHLICDHLTHWHATPLVRPYCYIMIDPVNYLFMVMFYGLLYITTLSCYHLNQAWCTWLVIVIFTGTLTCYTVSWSVTCIPALYAVTWLYSTYVLLIPDHDLFLLFPVKWYILISYNLNGYGRKWWMPEWYLAYSLGICYLITSTYLYKWR